VYPGHRPFWRRSRCPLPHPRAPRRAKKVAAGGEPQAAVPRGCK